MDPIATILPRTGRPHAPHAPHAAGGTRWPHGLAVVAVLLASVLLAAGALVQRATAERAAWVAHTIEVQRDLANLRGAHQRALHEAVAAGALGRVPDAATLAGAFDTLDGRLARLRIAVADNPDQLARLDRLQALAARQRDAVAALPARGGAALAEAGELHRRIEAVLREMDDEEARLRATRDAALDRSVDGIGWTILGAAMGALAMAAAAGALGLREARRRRAAEAARDAVVAGLERQVDERTAAARAAAARLAALVDGVPVALALFDRDGRLAAGNAPLGAMAGRAPAELPGLDAAAAGLGFLRPWLDAARDGAGPVRPGEPVVVGGRPLQVSVVALHDAAGMPDGAAAVLTDVAALEHARAQSARLSRHLLEVEESQRRTLAHELHDDLGQRLAAAKLALGLLALADAPPERDALRADAMAILEGCLARVRAHVAGLRPPLLDELGLGAALQALGTRDGADAGTRLESTVDDPELAARRDDWATHVFRIVQEAVRNATDHGGARTVQVALGRVGDAVRLRIEDDGTGLPPDAASRGTGLPGMRSRVELTGGRFTLDAGPLGGCRIEGLWPATALRPPVHGGAA